MDTYIGGSGGGNGPISSSSIKLLQAWTDLNLAIGLGSRKDCISTVVPAGVLGDNGLIVIEYSMWFQSGGSNNPTNASFGVSFGGTDITDSEYRISTVQDQWAASVNATVKVIIQNDMDTGRQKVTVNYVATGSTPVFDATPNGPIFGAANVDTTNDQDIHMYLTGSDSSNIKMNSFTMILYQGV